MQICGVQSSLDVGFLALEGNQCCVIHSSSCGTPFCLSCCTQFALPLTHLQLGEVSAEIGDLVGKLNFLTHTRVCRLSGGGMRATWISAVLSSSVGIQKLVLAGRVGEAIEATQHLYPGLLEHNPNLLFTLKWVCSCLSWGLGRRPALTPWWGASSMSLFLLKKMVCLTTWFVLCGIGWGPDWAIRLLLSDLFDGCLYCSSLVGDVQWEKG